VTDGVSHILDPSYLPSSTSSSSTSVYADIDGNLHDPDYCPFPTAATPHFPTWESGSNDNEVDPEDFDVKLTSTLTSIVPLLASIAVHATLPMRGL
jgi:hypothetical protein